MERRTACMTSLDIDEAIRCVPTFDDANMVLEETAISLPDDGHGTDLGGLM
jgi:hypothetical protein